MTIVVAIVEGAIRRMFDVAASIGRAEWWSQYCRDRPWQALDCGPAPYEPSNLATAFTGTGRGEHGCFSYWQMTDPHGGRPRVLASGDVHRDWFWNWPELKGWRKAVVNVQLTHPARAIEGSLVSYLMQQTLHFTYPPDLARRLHGEGFAFGHDVSAFYRGDGPQWLLDRAGKIARHQLEVGLRLGAEADILIINLTLIDRISHFFWQDFAATPSLHAEPCPLLDAYAQVDSALARLHRLAAGDPMVVFSEIGFGPLDTFVSIDDILEREGLLVLDDTLRTLPGSAFVRETPQGSHGFVCRDGDGRRSRGLCDEASALLRDLRDDDGRPMFASVWQAAEIYAGRKLSLAPDIVVEPSDAHRPPMGDRRWANHVNRHLQTGWHRNQGFFQVLNANPDLGPAFRLEDIAPTLAALLGADSPEGIEGVAFGQASRAELGVS